MKDRVPRLRAVVAGDGPERALLEALATKLGVAERFKILGLRSDIPDVLAALDVAVNCSVFEGTPLAILEYMDAALPIVATGVGGVPDILEDGRDGVLVDSGDAQGLGDAVADLLGDRERARALGERADARVVEVDRFVGPGELGLSERRDIEGRGQRGRGGGERHRLSPRSGAWDRRSRARQRASSFAIRLHRA